MNSRYQPNKYPYIELSRTNLNGSRHYVTPAGDKLPSVTSILDATRSEEKKQSLYEWRKRMGEKRAQEITTEAASRGTRTHKWLENYVKTGQISEPGSNPYSQQSHSMATKIIELGLSKCQEFWGTEINLYYPQIYAGTTDLIGLYDGKPAIMDFKQSNKPKQKSWIDDYFLQLVAYADCHNKLFDTDINTGVIFMITPDLQYQEFVIDEQEFKHWQQQWLKKLEQYYMHFV